MALYRMEAMTANLEAGDVASLLNVKIENRRRTYENQD
jgi:hypothetical protein